MYNFTGNQEHANQNNEIPFKYIRLAKKNSLILQSLCKDAKGISETLLMQLKTYIPCITVIPLLGR